jgi:hypothetical protein
VGAASADGLGSHRGGPTTWRSLSMAGVHAEAATRLARILRGNSCVQTLDLGWNTIGDEAGAAIASALPYTQASYALL